jgi:hypothetical protein
MLFKKKKKIDLPTPPELKLPEIKIEDIGKEELKPIESEIQPLPLETPKTEVKPIEVEKKEEIKGPIFVKITKYRDVLKLVEKTSKRIEEIEKDLQKLKKGKEEEEEKIRVIETAIEEMKRNLKEAEKILFSKLE